MDVLLAKLPGDPIANAAAVGAVLLAILDFLLGSVRALADGTFKVELVSSWVRSQLLGHVVPIILLVTFGQVAGDISIGDFHLNILLIAGEGAAATYAAVTAKSILDSVNRGAPDPLPTNPI